VERNWSGPKLKRLSRDSKNRPVKPRNCRAINDGTHGMFLAANSPVGLLLEHKFALFVISETPALGCSSIFLPSCPRSHLKSQNESEANFLFVCLDRTYAKLNERDDTKLSMSFRLEKNEPKGSNNWYVSLTGFNQHDCLRACLFNS
jgi:hypothetical protein